MSEISDEFKTIVVEAIQSVCIKFPRKHHILMSFLSSMLREEGGFEYKKAIVETVITIIEENPDAKEAGNIRTCIYVIGRIGKRKETDEGGSPMKGECGREGRRVGEMERWRKLKKERESGREWKGGREVKKGRKKEGGGRVEERERVMEGGKMEEKEREGAR